MSSYEEIRPRELKPALLRARRDLARVGRGPLQALPGLREQAERDPRQARRGRPRAARTRSTRRCARSRSSSRSRSAGSRTTSSISSTSAVTAATRRARSATWSSAISARPTAWRADLKATGLAGRGWAWTAYDWDEGRLFNYIGDAQNTFPIWNATPLVALDVYEHAYFLDYQTDRAPTSTRSSTIWTGLS